MSFEYLSVFLLLFPVWYCLVKCRQYVKPQYFVHLHLFSPAYGWRRWEWLLKFLITGFLIIALASPVFLDKNDPMNRHGIDIVLSIDSSGSMNASGLDTQTRQSRFEITQKIAQDFVMKRAEDNIGVVLFGDYAFIASPVTYEKEIVSEMIGYLSHGMAGANTAIGEGIAMAIRALEFGKASTKVIVLLTDGEHNSGKISPAEAVALAIERGIKIYTIGIGEESDFDGALLQKIADESDGEYFTARDKSELEDTYAEIDSLERSSIKSKAYLNKEFYYYVPLLIAFVLLLVFLALKERR